MAVVVSMNKEAVILLLLGIGCVVLSFNHYTAGNVSLGVGWAFAAWLSGYCAYMAKVKFGNGKTTK